MPLKSVTKLLQVANRWTCDTQQTKKTSLFYEFLGYS